MVVVEALQPRRWGPLLRLPRVLPLGQEPVKHIDQDGAVQESAEIPPLEIEMLTSPVVRYHR